MKNTGKRDLYLNFFQPVNLTIPMYLSSEQLCTFNLDANLLTRSCEGQCLNGGSCTLTSNGTKCSCNLGFFGDRCQNDGIYLCFLNML